MVRLAWDPFVFFEGETRRIRMFVLDANGDPRPEPDPVAWGRWYGDEQNCKVDETILAVEDGPVAVSTVFLGVDHCWSSDEPHVPILWETMIFGGHFDGMQARYTSRADAERGHHAMVRLVLSGTDP